ncbi:MAG: alpha/beta hydrolase [Buchananella hordeovulneris]|nr:alpha/beta hydrolase [Buchananella hordeovulneris]
MDIVLIGGLWLTVDVWEPVVAELAALGHRGIAVSLPGQDDGNKQATLADQLDAVTQAVAAADRPLLVGHSAAATLAWMAADSGPERVAGVVFIGGFPETDGAAYADFFVPEDGWMKFPGWEPFEGPDSADLSADDKAAMQARMVGVPAGVSKATVTLSSAARFELPVTVLCPEFSPEVAQAVIDGGDAPELAAAKNLELMDLDSGHWPMVSCPQLLAEALHKVTEKL